MSRSERRLEGHHLLFLCVAASVGWLAGASESASAQVVAGALVQTIETSSWSPPSPDPAGITYRPDTGELVTCDSEVDEMALFAFANLWLHSNTGAVSSTLNTIGFSNEPTGIAWDPAGGRLWISDDNADVIFEIDLGADGAYGTGDDRIVDLDGIRAAGCDDPEDVAYDNLHEALYVASGASREICRIEPGADGEFDGVPPTGDDLLSLIDVVPLGIANPEGVVYDPFEDTLVVADRNGTKDLYELTLDGSLVRQIDVPFPTGTRPSGVTIAPSTPNPSIRSYYVTDGRVDNDVDPLENDGRIFEVIAPPVGGNAAPVVDAGEAASVTWPVNGVSLSGAVSDDGHPYPPSAVTSAWSQLSGPGVVTFADETEPTTLATFSSPGSYVLDLSADDSELSSSDTVAIVVADPAPPPACGIGPELAALLLGLGRVRSRRNT